jgi:hypothetical protein
LPALAPEAAATTLASTTPTALSALAPEAAATTLASTTAPAAQAGIPSLLGENAAFIANNPSLYPAGFANPNTATLLTPSGTPYAIPSAASNVVPSTTGGTFTEGMAKFAKSPMASLKANPFTAAGSGLAGAIGGREELTAPEEYDGPLKRFRFNPETYRPAMFAEGGIATLDSGGYDRMVGEQPMYMSNMASGGISDLGSYSDGGRMLRGPGDGMSDSIPASIAGKRPARLATEEFVIPADVVSHLGNGSSDAGAKQLYAMMERVRKARTGRKSQGREIRPQKYMAA